MGISDELPVGYFFLGQDWHGSTHVRSRLCLANNSVHLPETRMIHMDQLVKEDDVVPVVNEIVSKTPGMTIKWYLIEVMRAMKGKANPTTVLKLLQEKIPKGDT